MFRVWGDVQVYSMGKCLSTSELRTTHVREIALHFVDCMARDSYAGEHLRNCFLARRGRGGWGWNGMGWGDMVKRCVGGGEIGLVFQEQGPKGLGGQVHSGRVFHPRKVIKSEDGA
jgi:hypothetical protein